MTDITTQWQKPIYTPTLRESPIAYQSLKIKCLHPSWTNQQVAKSMEQPYKRVERWSYKYFHKTRVQAYLEERCYDTIEKLNIEIIQTDLQECANRLPKDHKRLQKLQTIADHKIDKAVEQIENEQEVTKEQLQEINTAENTYQNANTKQATALQTRLRNIKENIDSERYNKDELPPAAKALIEQFERIEKDD